MILEVDDVILISRTLDGIQQTKQILTVKYEVRDMGELQDYLGLIIVRDLPTRMLFVH